MENTILVFGSAIIDFICYVPRLPKIGETLKGNKFQQGFGGKSANQCVAAARLGSKTIFIGKVGDDEWGKSYINKMKTEHVDITYFKGVPGEVTGIAQINVAENGDNQIVIVTGANDLLSAKDVLDAIEIFQKAKVLICSFETPIEGTLEALNQFKGISIVNGAPARENIPEDIIKKASIFCVNEIEAEVTTEIEIKTVLDAKKAALKLLEMGSNSIIITLGEQGAVYTNSAQPNSVFHVKAPKVTKVIDTTGAGDAFIGALAHFIAEYPNERMEKKISAACKVSSISVQYPGTQSSFPFSKDCQIDFKNDNFDYCSI